PQLHDPTVDPRHAAAHAATALALQNGLLQRAAIASETRWSHCSHQRGAGGTSIDTDGFGGKARGGAGGGAGIRRFPVFVSRQWTAKTRSEDARRLSRVSAAIAAWTSRYQAAWLAAPTMRVMRPNRL